MAGGEFIWANQLAILIAGAAPEWVQQTTYLDVPTTAGEGVDVRGALITGIDIRTRLVPTSRSMVISATTFVGDGTSYDIQVNGTTYSGTGTYATAEELFDDLVVEMAAIVGTLVTATVSGTGNDAVLTVATIDTDDVSYGFVGDGTDEFIVEADCISAVLDFYSLQNGSNPTGYWSYNDSSTFSLTVKGLTGPRVNTSQCSRMYCHATPTGHVDDGTEVVQTVQIYFGPSFSTTPGVV
jgi:hypothetical protein